MILMEKQLLAIGFESHSNYIKLPESVLTEFVQPKNSLEQFPEHKIKKQKGIKFHEQLKSQEIKILPPYYFSIESSFGKFAYSGVLDFTAEEGMCMIPTGVQENLDIYGSDFVTIRYIGNVPKGDFVQLEPMEKDIFDIPELDKYLEIVISNYCLLYVDQIITCAYGDCQYNIKVRSIKSICEFDVEPELIDIVNTDLKIDIFNKFLEEELKEKKRLQEEKEKALKEQEEKKRKEEDDKKKLCNQTGGYFSGSGIKLGGIIETSDPALMREIRLQKLLALQNQQVSILKPVENKTTNAINTIDAVQTKISNLNIGKTSTNEKPKQKKSKDIEV